MGNGNPINSAAIEDAVKKIDERLAQKTEDAKPDTETKKLKKAKKTLEKDYLPRMKKYEDQEEILANRNSYSKTDHDATFMRMKEDHMKNGQLKPGYNVQIGTENQFIVGYSIHQRPGDTSCMKEHLETVKNILDGTFPKNVIADAGYGRPLVFKFEQKRKSENGYVSTIRIYECLDCSGCPHRNKCVKSENPSANRKLNINLKLNDYKEKAKQNLCSEEGLKMRSLRPVEVESVFGDIKGNFGMRRFCLRD